MGPYQTLAVISVFALVIVIIIIQERKTPVEIREQIKNLVENGIELTKLHTHIYKNGKDKYTILFFNNKSNLKDIPEENFEDIEDAVERWWDLVENG